MLIKMVSLIRDAQVRHVSELAWVSLAPKLLQFVKSDRPILVP